MGQRHLGCRPAGRSGPATVTARACVARGSPRHLTFGSRCDENVGSAAISATTAAAPKARMHPDPEIEKLRVEVDKLGKQFKYASTRGFGFVTVVGGDERAAGQVTVKNMQSGEQTVVARDQAATWLAAKIVEP